LTGVVKVFIGPDKQVPPEVLRRGTLVVPGEEERVINRCSSDPTSGSLREIVRRGTLVVPGERAMDNPTSNGGPDKQVPPKRALRKTDVTGTSLQRYA